MEEDCLMFFAGIKTSNNEIEFIPKYKLGNDTWAIGTIYIQYPGEAAPEDLLGGTWQNVSADYANRFFRAPNGVFFRAEGSDTCPFEEGTQSSNLYVDTVYSLTSGGSHCHAYSSNCLVSATFYCSGDSGACCMLVNIGRTALGGCVCGASHTHSTSRTSCTCGDVETRPKNYTIRIWKKIGD